MGDDELVYRSTYEYIQSQGHSFWYQSISHIRLHIDSRGCRELDTTSKQRSRSFILIQYEIL